MNFLQSLVAGDEHEEIDEVGGDDLKEEHNDEVREPVCSDGTIWVPQSSVEGILVGELLAFLQNFTPGHSLDVIAGNIVARHLVIHIVPATKYNLLINYHITIESENAYLR